MKILVTVTRRSVLVECMESGEWVDSRVFNLSDPDYIISHLNMLASQGFKPLHDSDSGIINSIRRRCEQ